MISTILPNPEHTVPGLGCMVVLGLAFRFILKVGGVIGVRHVSEADNANVNPLSIKPLPLIGIIKRNSTIKAFERKRRGFTNHGSTLSSQESTPRPDFEPYCLMKLM